MVDRDRAATFAALGAARPLFRDVARWSRLTDLFEQYSGVVLAQRGGEGWSALGGEYGPDGRPTCRPDSPMASHVVRQVAARDGGLVWTDGDGAAWAVRLVP